MDSVVSACRQALARSGAVIALTGAGISAESGVPTFRGKDGYWTVGAHEYRAQELATAAAFSRMPWDVWAWYLHRRSVCRAAQPNKAHASLVELDAALGDRFALVTQNVDGLHRRAGSPAERLFPVHGDIDLMRCAFECTNDRWPIPDDVPAVAKGDLLDEAIRAQLVCRSCGRIARPHVLWFDELYDEAHCFAYTTRQIAERATLVLVIGTSASTNLPWQVITLALRAGATVVDINVEDNPFGELASGSGGIVRAPAAIAVPALIDSIR